MIGRNRGRSVANPRGLTVPRVGLDEKRAYRKLTPTAFGLAPVQAESATVKQACSSSSAKPGAAISSNIGIYLRRVSRPATRLGSSSPTAQAPRRSTGQRLRGTGRAALFQGVSHRGRWCAGASRSSRRCNRRTMTFMAGSLRSLSLPALHPGTGGGRAKSRRRSSGIRSGPQAGARRREYLLPHSACDAAHG
jgi:hypothetical protein